MHFNSLKKTAILLSLAITLNSPALIAFGQETATVTADTSSSEAPAAPAEASTETMTATTGTTETTTATTETTMAMPKTTETTTATTATTGTTEPTTGTTETTTGTTETMTGTTETATGTTATTETQENTIGAPAVPSITYIAGGGKCAKLYWNKVEGAEGYTVYMSEDNVTYNKIATLTSKDELKYIKTGLTQYKTYYFYVKSYIKKTDGTLVESAPSLVQNATTTSVSATSASPAKYATKEKFLASPAYKKFTAIQNNYKYSKSFAIPGVKNTNVGGFANKNMAAKGMCFAGAYVLMAASDKNAADESVIYILSKSSHSYITTLVLPDKIAAEGLAYDGSNIWITGTNGLSAIPYSEITSAVASGASYKYAEAYSAQVSLDFVTSYCTYYNNTLWVGSYNPSAATYAYGYKISGQGTSTVFTKTMQMQMPASTRAMSISNSGKMVITRSNKATNAEGGYCSQTKSFQPDFAKPLADGTVLKGSVKAKYKLPPLCDSVAIKGSYVYISFTSAKESSCKYPVDRVLALKKSKFF